MAEPDPLLPALDPRSAAAVEAASVARELVTAYLSVGQDPALLRMSLRSALAELYDGLRPTTAHTERAASLLCSMAALLQVALSGIGQLAVATEGEVDGDETATLDVAVVFEQLVASAVDDGLTF
ncbi:MAG: hypothetical protein M3N15_05615 [Actinomycetota bacterium]|nr:hypothetical protein [Actinomycetota bacterium]